MSAVARLIEGAYAAIRKAVGTLRGFIARAVRAVASAARAVPRTISITVAETRERHAERWGEDDQYRALLLTALGALLSTLVPPALAAAVTAGIGLTGMLDEPPAPQSRHTERTSKYRNPDATRAERSYAVPLWDRFNDED